MSNTISLTDRNTYYFIQNILRRFNTLRVPVTMFTVTMFTVTMFTVTMFTVTMFTYRFDEF